MRTRLLTGLIIVIPVVVTFWVTKFFVLTIAGLLQPLIRLALDEIFPGFDIALSIVLFVLLVYLVGVLATHVVGRRLIELGEALLSRIPLVKTVYSASKQAVEALSLPNRAAFKKIVFVEFPRPGMWVPAFVTRALTDNTGRRYYALYVPTTPNPTSGYLEIVPVEDVIETDMSVEEGIKMIVSGGIVGPAQLNAEFPAQPPERERV